MAKKKPPVEQLSREELLALVRELERKNAELLQENQRLKRAQHRQATPFSKERLVNNPKKPGRKPGGDYGTKARRQPPRSRILTLMRHISDKSNVGHWSARPVRRIRAINRHPGAIKF